MDAKEIGGTPTDICRMGMYRMLQIDEPGTFVLATNKTQTVRGLLFALAIQRQ